MYNLARLYANQSVLHASALIKDDRPCITRHFALWAIGDGSESGRGTESHRMVVWEIWRLVDAVV